MYSLLSTTFDLSSEKVPSCDHFTMSWSMEMGFMCTVVMGQNIFEVLYSIIRSQKLGVRVRLAKDEHVQVRSIFNGRKNDVWVCSMNNLVKAFWVRCLMFVLLRQKFKCSSSIINRWTRSSLFNVQKMMFKFVRCLIKWCSTHH